LLILWQQHPRPLAPGLSRRPCAAAYGPGPSVFTIRARRAGTHRASVSQAVARRGTPPLPPMSLGACRRCCRGGTPAGCKSVSPFLGLPPRPSKTGKGSGARTLPGRDEAQDLVIVRGGGAAAVPIIGREI
jgi:hypothetical protein